VVMLLKDNSLTYLEKTIREVLRLYPPTALIPRSAEENILFANDSFGENFIIHQGDFIFISPYCTHRREDVYMNAKSFNPDRHESRNITYPDNNPNYITFGSGPRRCLGSDFAKLELMLFLGLIYSRYEVSVDQQLLPDGSIPVVLSGTLKPAYPYALTFKTRCSPHRKIAKDQVVMTD
jgi:cytochrome P450